MADPVVEFQSRLDALLPTGDNRVIALVDAILTTGIERRASDVHIEPTTATADIRFRIDGVLRTVAALPRELAPNLVARLKVMAELLTYRVDVPQEGSIRRGPAEMRVSTFPTVHGEKAVIRLFVSERSHELNQLGLPPSLLQQLIDLSHARSGAIFLTGPSGSGKTTTIYACLQHLVAEDQGRHIVTIEDPVERLLAGVTQTAARPGTEFDFARGLRSLLRQDPDVIMIGEIRDRETAAIAIEAALTGHLVFTTLHAGSAAGVVGRLLEMGIEPYLLTSAIRGILNQRLLRRSCDGCPGPSCPRCQGAGFVGRILIAELLQPDAAFRATILAKGDTDALEAVAAQSGLTNVRDAAKLAVAAGHTTKAEVERVLGPERKITGEVHTMATPGVRTG